VCEPSFEVSPGTEIASKMTAVLQLIDTDVSFPERAAAQRKKDQMREMVRWFLSSTAAQQPSPDIGPVERLQIVHVFTSTWRR
jgi:hypothetical protein